MGETPGSRLEKYSAKHPQEVLVVRVELEGEWDQIVIFKGFSSSLIRPTASDPDVPVLPEGAQVLGIDRVKSPYNPNSPQYLEQGLSWECMELLLLATGV